MGTTSAIASALAGTATTGTGTTGTSSASTGNGALASLSSNFATFLNLLTTQLQHQDPTAPVDSTQFTQELVQFSGVEAQQQTNTLLQQILTAVQSSQIGSASSYVGSTVQATGDQGVLSNGTANFGYTLPSQAAKADVTITDSSGNIVFSGTGPTGAGPNNVNWNGANSFTGAAEPNGVYTINVKATDANGKAITATPYVTGTVTSASVSNGAVILDLNGLQVPLSNVTSITNLQNASGGKGTSTGTTTGSTSSTTGA